MAKRGRPAMQMTHRRKAVLAAAGAAIAQGERLTYSALARRCGLCDYREARRIFSDLKRMAERHGETDAQPI